MVSAFLPIWVLTGIGYLVARTRVLGPAATDVLGRFVFLVAMPAALFGTLSRAPLARFGGIGLLAFATSTFLVGGLAFALARWVLHRGLSEQAIGGMAAGYVNAANLGIPVAVRILGDASFLAVVLLFQVLVLAPLVLSALDADAAQHPGGEADAGVRAPDGATAEPGRQRTEQVRVPPRMRNRVRVRRLASLPLRNPILLACVCGVAVHSAGWEVPGQLRSVVTLLGSAAVPTALVALGLSLHRPPPVAPHETPREAAAPATDARAQAAGERRRWELAIVVILKIVAQPVLAYVIAHLLLGLHGSQLLAVVVCAALPTAQNTFLFARAYGVDSRLARDTVVLSTALSMVTLTVAATLLSG